MVKLNRKILIHILKIILVVTIFLIGLIAWKIHDHFQDNIIALMISGTVRIFIIIIPTILWWDKYVDKNLRRWINQK